MIPHISKPRPTKQTYKKLNPKTSRHNAVRYSASWTRAPFSTDSLRLCNNKATKWLPSWRGDSILRKWMPVATRGGTRLKCSQSESLHGNLLECLRVGSRCNWGCFANICRIYVLQLWALSLLLLSVYHYYLYCYSILGFARGKLLCIWLLFLVGIIPWKKNWIKILDYH